MPNRCIRPNRANGAIQGRASARKRKKWHALTSFPLVFSSSPLVFFLSHRSGSLQLSSLNPSFSLPFPFISPGGAAGGADGLKRRREGLRGRRRRVAGGGAGARQTHGWQRWAAFSGGLQRRRCAAVVGGVRRFRSGK